MNKTKRWIIIIIILDDDDDIDVEEEDDVEDDDWGLRINVWGWGWGYEQREDGIKDNSRRRRCYSFYDIIILIGSPFDIDVDVGDVKKKKK